MDGRNFQEVNDPVRGRDRWEESAEKLTEGYADGGNSAGLNHQKKRPAVKKSPKRPERFSEVNILTAGARHHSSQFAVTQGRDDGEEAGHQVGTDQQSGRVDLSGDFRGNDENGGADHGAHDQHTGAGQSQTLYQFCILTTVDI